MDFNGRKAICAGADDYKKAVSSCYVVDKTLLIKELADSGSLVTVFERPHGYGKTLNLSMMRAFYEKTDEDASVYFRDRKIWQCGPGYIEEQGKYPVIWLSFKNTVKASWKESLAAVEDMVACEYERYSALTGYADIPAVHRILYGSIAGKRAPQAFLESSLLVLSVIITECCGISPVVLVDDYDALADGGRRYGYYDEATSFVGNFLSAGLKTNGSISFAVLTGTGNGSEKGILNSLNNANVYSASSKQFTERFGFTADETEELLLYYGYEGVDEAVKRLDGCLIGSRKMLSPEQVFRLLEESRAERLSRI